MDISVSIVSWNTRELLDQCISSIYAASDDMNVEIIVVDNSSSDGSQQMTKEKYPCVRLVENSANLGFPRANNQAFELSTGRYFLLLNPDTVCLPGSLNGMVRFLDQNPCAGVVGPLVRNPDGTLQHSWSRFPTIWSEFKGRLNRSISGLSHVPQTAKDTIAIGPFQTDWVGGCCLLIRRSAVEKVGQMDESFFMYSEETDWCFRLKQAGMEVWVEPAAEIVHIGGQSSSQASAESARQLRRSKSIYFGKHHGAVQAVTLSALLYAKSSVLSLARRGRNFSPQDKK